YLDMLFLFLFRIISCTIILYLFHYTTLFRSTDMAREYKKLSKEHGQVKEKYSGLVERFNENVNDYNELLEENKSLKSKISDLKRDVSLIYESTKEFLKERTDG